MLDDFFVRALLAGTGLMLAAGPLGCLVVWRRLAYAGDTLAHSALLGLAIAILFNLNASLGIFSVAGLLGLSLILLTRSTRLTSDTVLGILAHGSLALGLLVFAALPQARVNLLGALLGDVLAVGRDEVALIWGGSLSVLLILTLAWRPLLASTLSPAIAEAEGQRPQAMRFLLLLLLSALIALAIQLVGVLLISALLIIPAAAGRRLATSPETMALAATLVGLASVVLGLYASLWLDLPSGPAIVVATLIFFMLSLIIRRNV